MQTVATHGSQFGSSATPLTHLSCAQLFGHWPQSLGQLMHVSPASHVPLGHTGPHWPQSVAQFMQSSPGSQFVSPQTGPPVEDETALEAEEEAATLEEDAAFAPEVAVCPL